MKHDENFIKSCILKGKTGNPFSFFSMDDMSTCYQYYEDYARSLIQALQPLHNPYHEKEIKEFNFSYLWDNKVNAGSVEKPVSDIITINQGTLITIYGMFYRLMVKVSNFFSLSVSVPPFIEIDNNVTYDNEENPRDTIKYELIVSDNPIVNNLAEVMAMFAIKWVIAHEIGHVYNGHTKYYLEVRRKIEKIGHSDESNRNRLLQCYLDLQTMEMDADAFASTQIMTEALHLYENSGSEYLKLKNKKDIFLLPIYAIYGVFYLIRDDGGVNFKHMEHPPAFVRELLAISAVRETLKSNNLHFDNDFYTGEFGRFNQSMCIANKTTNECYVNYVKDFSVDAENWANELRNNYFNRVSRIIKTETRLPVEGMDYNT